MKKLAAGIGVGADAALKAVIADPGAMAPADLVPAVAQEAPGQKASAGRVLVDPAAIGVAAAVAVADVFKAAMTVAEAGEAFGAMKSAVNCRLFLPLMLISSRKKRALNHSRARLN